MRQLCDKEQSMIVLKVKSRVADPAAVDPDPEPTIGKCRVADPAAVDPDPVPTPGKSRVVDPAGVDPGSRTDSVEIQSCGFGCS